MDFPKFPLRNPLVTDILGVLAHAVAQKVFSCGAHIVCPVTVPLQTLYIGTAHGSNQRGVLAVGFAQTSPALIAAYIKNGTKGMIVAFGAILPPDQSRHFSDSITIKGRAHGDGHRRSDCIRKEGTGGNLHVEERGNPQSCFFYQIPLNFLNGFCTSLCI